MEKLYIKEIITKFNNATIRYILIGRQAVVLYGFPVLSFDYDFWVYPEDRDKLFDILLGEDFEPSSLLEDKKPIVFFIKQEYKIDVFFAKSFGKLSFEDCFNNAKLLSEGDFFIRVASPKDLIYLKQFRKPLKAKDKEDIKFLTKLIRKKK